MTRTKGASGPMTIAEKKAYQRGHAAARNRAWGWAKRLLTLLKAYRDRAKLASPTGRCDTCRRWTRGGGGDNPRIMWGNCSGGFEWDAEPNAWAEPVTDRRTWRLVCHENFGCVNWLPREGPRG